MKLNRNAGRCRRRAASLAVLAAAAFAAPAAVCAQALTYSLDLPAQDLSAALRAFATATHQQVVFDAALTRGRTSAAVKGTYSADEALKALLAGAGVSAERNAQGVFVVRPLASPQALAAEPTTDVSGVVVTATKRPERVRQVSGSISAMSGADIEAIGASSWSDYLARMPGVVLNDSIPGWSFVTIRGISSTTASEQGQTTTGYYINDIPLTDPTYSIGNPDIDAFDVDNVSVLRGPQATLYGAAALGGVINYQAATPNLSRRQFRFEAGGQATSGAEAGGSAKLMVNMPLIQDVLAARLTYVYRKDGGYIDNVGIRKDDSNSSVTKGGRFQLAWQPAADTRLNYMFLYQEQKTDDMGYQEPGVGALKKSTLIAEPQYFSTAINSLRLDQETPLGAVTAIAAYHRKTQHIVTDATPFFAGLAANVPYYNNTQLAQSEGGSGELRLASPAGRKLEYLAGAFYANNRDPIDEPFSGPNVTAGVNAQWGGAFGPTIGDQTAQGDVLFEGASRFQVVERAVFGEATYHLNDQWKLTAGGRYFQDTVRETSITSHFLNVLLHGAPQTVISGQQKSNDFLPKASITWTRDQDLMIYGLVSKGFRLGGVNLQLAQVGQTPPPPTYNPDSLVNYEIGFRSTWLERTLQVDGTAFYIDWSNVQLPFSAPGGARFQTNAGKARSEGFEGVVAWTPVRGLTLGSNLTYLDATLANAFDPGNGQPIVPQGAMLPGASRWQVSDSVSYQWLDRPLTPTLTVLHRYLSRAPGQFNQVGVGQGGYDKVDARLTLHGARADVSLFANNISDSRGVTTAFAGSLPLGQYVLRPRMLGVTVDVKLQD